MFIFYILPIIVLGEPKTFVMTEFPLFITPPIGLGPNGGRLFGKVEFENNSTLLLFVLSSNQYDSWTSLLPTLTYPLQPNEMITTHLQPIINGVFDVTLKNIDSEQFYVGIYSPRIQNVLLNVDWILSDGTFLQYQYVPLALVLRVMMTILMVFLIGYVGKYIVGHYKSSTQLHLFYVSVFLFTLAFLTEWIDSLDIEAVTGQRETWKTKWVPSLYQKGFDILEVLMYLLTALGWQTMRETLTYKEVQIIASGVGLSILLGILEIHCDGDEIQCGGYTSTRMIIHMFGYLTAIVAFNYHLAFLTASVDEGSIASTQTGFLYIKLFQFWWFRLIFLAFIIQPTVAIVIRTDLLGWQDDWIFIGFFWVSKIFLLAALAVAFRPGRRNLKLVQLAVKERRRLVPDLVSGLR